MNLAEALLPWLPRRSLRPAGRVIALVGAGGKTSALFGLGEELSARGASVLLTTTTHILDPRTEPGRPFDQVVLDPALEAPAGTGLPGPWSLEPAPPGRGRRIVLAARELPELGKLKGVHPSRIDELAELAELVELAGRAGLERSWPFILVEADGAKGRPVKAPAPHEPVLPAGTGLVLGVVGLDCLGRPMDEASVHRPERFEEATGCGPGAPIRLEHLAALTRSPLGLFKGAPRGARRVLLLNKADRAPADPASLLRQLLAAAPWADLILVAALGGPRPDQVILAQAEPQYSGGHDGGAAPA